VPDDVLALFRAAYEEAATSGKTLPELSTEIPAILIKLGEWVAAPDPDTGRPGYGYRPGMTPDELYESTRASWVLDAQRAEGFRYAVVVHQGVTLAVWETTPGSWKRSSPKPGESVRWSFEGTPAPAEIAEAFVGPRGKRVPQFRPSGLNVFGQANPIAYWP
jgi:hypothetical protein